MMEWFMWVYYTFGIVFTLIKMSGVHDRIYEHYKDNKAALILVPYMAASMTMLLAWLWVLIALLDLIRFIVIGYKKVTNEKRF